MTIFYGTMDRKALVAAIEEITGEKRRYLGVPSCAYKVGDFLVTREGNLDDGGSGMASELVEKLASRGFVEEPEADGVAEKSAEKTPTMEQEKPPQAASEKIDVAKEEADYSMAETVWGEAFQEEATHEVVSGLDISVPADKVNLEKLASLLQAKGELIRKALGVEELSIKEADGKVIFPWFRESMDADRAQAYINFVSAICKAFKQDRKILLERLSGSSAFKVAKEAADDEISE